MKFFRLSLITFTLAAILTGCNSGRIEESASVNPNPARIAESENNSGENPCLARENSTSDSRLSVIDCDENSYFARENLNLQAVGRLLEKANNAEEFEYLLNSQEGVNNLDLNGDGYADYISVAEYDDSDTNQRGFTLFDRFGVDEIQEIARIIFDRDRLDAPGARILLSGNEQLYGDNYYYETDWQDKSLAIANWAFGNRDRSYESPYYYDNYPNDYNAYQVVETPVYRTRIEQYYAAPVFVKTVNPTITQIKIKSRYNGKSAEKIFANLAKPTKEQVNFKKNNPNKPDFVIVENGKTKEFSKNKKEKNSNDFEKRGGGNKDNLEFRNNSERFEQENVKPNKQNEIRQEKVKPNKSDKADKQNRGNGDGNEKGNGKSNGKSNGGGKGNGKGGKN